MLIEINKNVNFLLKEISVNGSKGLENILKDHQAHFKKMDERISVINDCTQYLQSKRKLQKAVTEYFFERPRLAVLFSFLISWKGFILVVLGMAFLFNIIEPSIILKLITKILP